MHFFFDQARSGQRRGARNRTKGAMAGLLAGVLAACGGATALQPFQDRGIAWPEPPGTARIEFAGEFSSPADLGIQPTLWGRLVSFVAGSGNQKMVGPMAVAVSVDGDMIFVADPGARCVHQYDLQKGRYQCLQAGPDAPELVSPVGLAIADDGRLFVTDSKLGKLFELPPGAQDLKVFAAELTLEQPTGIAWSSRSGSLYVTDTGSHSIKVVNLDGSLVTGFGRRGNLPGEFNFPTYLWVDGSGEVLVADSLNFRIQRFSGDGIFLSLFGEIGDTAGSLGRPKGVATDGYGNIYVMDGVLHAMQIFGPDGRLLLAIGGRGQAPGEFWLPAGMFVRAGNLIYVADAYNRRVQVFRYVGGEP